MAELPRGTVTFLFTDIEGSTRLLQQLGERYGDALAEHNRILRQAAEPRGGREMDTQGDSFFFAFARANAALAAAVAAQRALAEHGWPDGSHLRVRMGLHTGEPAVGDEHYVGLGVHRAARIAAVGHGGQVLLSGATHELVQDHIDGASIRELGPYRLKDLDRPERLYQLDIDGLQSDFPPLKAEKVAEARPLRRRGVVLAALAGAIAAAVSIPIFALGGGGGGGSIAKAASDSLGIVDPGSGRLVADVPVGATPTHVAVGEDAYWVTNADGHSVSRIDPAKKTVVQTIPVGSGPSGITVGNGAVWVANSLDGTVSRIDAATNTVVQTIPVGNVPVGLTHAAGSIWVANTGDQTITRIDAESGTPMKTLPIAATELAFGDGTLWATDSAAGRVTRIDPKTGKIAATISVGNGPTALAFGNGAAWVANSLDGTVSRIDPARNSVAAVIPTGDGVTSVAVGGSNVWVSNQFDSSVARIDPRTNRPTRISVGNRPQGVAVSGGNLLVAVRESGTGHRGGTLTMRLSRGSPPDSIDTAVAYLTTSWPFLRMTNDGLVAFNQVGGIQGTQLVPDLAVSLPAPTDGGRTYTFRLRPNIRYSTGSPVKASDVRSTFERDFKVGKLPVTYYDGIVGAARCKTRPKRCDLSRGIVANDATGTVTFHLVAPDSEFLDKLALPFAYVLPAGTPTQEAVAHPLPATGPYVLTNRRSKHVLKYVRNRYFHEWSKAAQPDGYPDEIVARIGGSAGQALRDVIRGKADVVSTWGSGTPSPGELARIKTRYASQVHSNPGAALYALFLNTRLPPFDRVGVRRALNYAADRAAAVQAIGGPDQAQVTCQILPPNTPGYQPYCPYTVGSTTSGSWTGPDLAKARALVARSGTRGMKITAWSWSGEPGLGQYAVRLLRSIGYRASLKVLGDAYFSTVFDPHTKAQMGFNGYFPDYPAASDFFNNNFTCAPGLPKQPDDRNIAQFCESHLGRTIERALAEQAKNPQAALGLWERADRLTVDQAPWVPLVNPKIVDVLAKRVGNYQYNTVNGVLIDQLWVH